jgi:Rieske Fe-S protein
MATHLAAGRRSWLLRGLKTGVAVTLGAVLYPVARFLRPRPATRAGALEVVAPFRLADLKADSEGRWPGLFEFGGKPCLVILTPDGQLKAFNAICTHVDCTVEFRAGKKDIYCACHSGVYDLNGRNVSGPPPRPLETYKVTTRGEPGKEEIVVSRST